MNNDKKGHEGLPATPSGSTLQVLAEDGSGLSAAIPKPPAHSPLPWSWTPGNGSWAPGVALIHSGDCDGIDAWSTDTSKRVAWASEMNDRMSPDAEFICRAANSYYPSREIIEKLVNVIDELSHNPEVGPAWVKASGLITEARAFLNKNVKP